MRTLLSTMRQALSGRRSPRRPTFRLTLEPLEQRTLLDAAPGFVQAALVSDIAGLAPHTDRDLINPWGFSETPDGQFRVSANGAGNAPLFTARGDILGGAVVIPPALGSPPGTTSTPNGNITNTTSDFVISDDGRSAPATVLFSTEDGTIAGFNPRVDRKEAILVADQSAAGAVYKLLAMGSNSQGNFLYATNFHNDTIDVFDKHFHKVILGTGGFGTFADPNAPAGFAPFGIKNINGTLVVTYAKQKAPDNHDDQEGPGNGFIDEFDTSGHFLKRFASGTAAGGTLTELNSPIGMAVAPAGFGPGGKFSNALLVGNFGDSHVNAFDLSTGAFLGQISDAQGKPLTLNVGVGGHDTKGLWGIAFGNGHGGADTHTLFFAAGINNEVDGVFGKVTMTGAHHDQEDMDPGKHDHDDMPSSGHDHDTEHQAARSTGATANLEALVAAILGDSGAHGLTGKGDAGTLGVSGGRHDAGSSRAPSGTQSALEQVLAAVRAAESSIGSAHASAHKVIDFLFKDLSLDPLG